MQGDMVIYQHAHDYRGCPLAITVPASTAERTGQLRRTKQLYPERGGKR